MTPEENIYPCLGIGHVQRDEHQKEKVREEVGDKPVEGHRHVDQDEAEQAGQLLDVVRLLRGRVDVVGLRN